MTRLDDPYSVYKCVASRTCPGERSPFPEVWNLHPEQRMCIAGVEVDTRCGQCEAGRYGQAESSCSSCGGQAHFMFGVKLAITFAANVGFVAYMYKRFNRPNPAGMITLACIINALQSMQTFGKMPLDWPSALRHLFGVLDVLASVDGLMAFLEFKTECVTGNSYASSLIKEVLSPQLIFVDFIIIYVLVRLLGYQLRKAYVHNVVGMLFTRLFINIIRLSLSLFYRESMPNGKVMVTAIPTLEFLSEEWIQLLPINAVATLAYGGTTFCYVAYLVHSAPYRVATEPDFLDKARFCFGAFRPDRHWWILIHLSYGFLLNLSQVMTPSSNVHSKVYLSLFFLVIFLVLEFRCKPYKFTENNVVDIMFNTLLIALLIVSTSFIDSGTVSQSQRDTWNEIYAAFVLVFFAIGLAWAIWRFTHWIWSVAQHKGIIEGERAEYGWQFRDCVVSLLLLSDKNFMRRLCALGDNDLKQLRHATDTIISVFFGAHTSPSLMRQRLIPGHEYKVWNYEHMQLAAWEQIESGELRRRVAHSFRARVWLLQMAIAAGAQEDASTQEDTSDANDEGPAPSEATSTRQSWPVAMSTSAVAMSTSVASTVGGAVKDKVQMPLLKHIETLVQVLGIRPSQPVTKEGFRKMVSKAFPQLNIPEDDVDRIFDIMDMQDAGQFHRSEFVLVLHALVPGWMLEVKGLTNMVSGHMDPGMSCSTDPTQGPTTFMNAEDAQRIDAVLNHMTGKPSRKSRGDGAHVVTSHHDEHPSGTKEMEDLSRLQTIVAL